MRNYGKEGYVIVTVTVTVRRDTRDDAVSDREADEREDGAGHRIASEPIA